MNNCVYYLCSLLTWYSYQPNIYEWHDDLKSWPSTGDIKKTVHSPFLPPNPISGTFIDQTYSNIYLELMNALLIAPADAYHAWMIRATDFPTYFSTFSSHSFPIRQVEISPPHVPQLSVMWSVPHGTTLTLSHSINELRCVPMYQYGKSNGIHYFF